METKQKYEEFFKKIEKADLNELAQMFNCKPSDIYCNDIDDDTDEFESIPYKVVIGDIDLSGMGTVNDFGNAEVIIGDVNIGQFGKIPTDIESFNKVKYIYGNVTASQCYLKDLGDLTAVVGQAMFEETELNSTSNLEYVGYDLNLQGNDHLYKVPNLKYVGGLLVVNESPVRDLSSLEHVGSFEGDEIIDDDEPYILSKDALKKGRTR